MRETVRELVSRYLRLNGYDGLYSENCGCELKDLAPCDESFLDCRPGYKVPAPENDPEGWDFYIRPKPPLRKKRTEHLGYWNFRTVQGLPYIRYYDRSMRSTSRNDPWDLKPPIYYGME